MRFRPNSPRSLLLLLRVAGLCTGVLAAGCNGNIGQATPGAAGSSGTGNTQGGGNTTGAGNSIGTGTGGAGNTGVTPTGETCAQVGMDTGAATLRRLSNLEYQLTVQDLFQLTAAPSVDSIPPDVDNDGFRTYASLQSVSAQHLRAYIDRAHGLADELMADSARRSRVLGCEPTASGCLRAFVGRFGRLAYRRPLETVEQDTIVSRATADALDATDQFRFAIEVMLSSSSFLYRVEVGNPADAVATLNPYELASRLSFALWGRAPDAALLDKAAAGELATPEGLATTATTLLADARAKIFYQAFFRQWLGFEGMQAPPNPPAGWSDALVADMTRETQSVVDDFAWGHKNLLGALTANYTRPTAALSTYYGLPAAAADGTATFPAGHARANTGLLTHPSLLAAKRDGDLIAMRGNWLRRTFFCRTLHIDPNVAEMLGELLVGLSRVEIVKKRNTEAACSACHAAIDPIGIGFVQFDHTGRFDGSIDGSVYGIAPRLPDAVANPAFANVAELASKLQAMPEVSACLAAKLFTYTEGRAPVRADTCAVEAASKGFASGGNDFAEMLKGRVTEPSFRLRRAAGVTP
jgi:hypothetical protein